MFINKNLTLKSFGQRGHDLDNLISAKSNVLGVTKDPMYTIGIVGDSYSWGMGVKYSKTVSQLLEKKLNQQRPTKVYNFSEPGDSILEYYAHAKKAQEKYPIDLFIVMMVSNDLALNKDYRLPLNDYQQIVANCQTKHPESPIYYWLDWAQFIRNNPKYTPSKIVETTESNVINSWTSASNLCVLDDIITKFPKNTIFLITDDYTKSANGPFYSTYRSAIEKQGLTVISSSKQKYNSKYSIYWESGNPWRYFRVSQNEYHPSHLAHQMYSDTLFEEIVSNHNFRFKE